MSAAAKILPCQEPCLSQIAEEKAAMESLKNPGVAG